MMKPLRFGMACAWAWFLTVAVGVAAEAPAPAQPPEVTFRSRVKREQSAPYLLKVFVDQKSMPLDSDVLDTLVNSPVVVGRVARQLYGLEEDYPFYVKVKTRVAQGPDSALAQMEVTLKADQLVSPAAFDRLAQALREQLIAALGQTVATDQEMLTRKREQYQSRRELLMSELLSLRARRVSLTIGAGLAEVPGNYYRAAVGRLLTDQQKLALDLAVKQAQCEALQARADKDAAAGAGAAGAKGAGAGARAVMAEDAVAAELQRLVEKRSKLVETLTRERAPQEQIDQAEVQLSEATVRWTQRQEELRQGTPQQQLARVGPEYLELQTRQRVTQDTLVEARKQAGAQFQADDEVAFIEAQEDALRQRIRTLEQQTDEITQRLEGLQDIRVELVGQQRKK